MSDYLYLGAIWSIYNQKPVCGHFICTYFNTAHAYRLKNMLLKHSFCRSFDTSREKCYNVLLEECRIARVNAPECKEGVLMQETQKKKILILICFILFCKSVVFLMVFYFRPYYLSRFRSVFI